MSSLHDATVTAVTLAANDLNYGVAVNGKAIELLADAALATRQQDIVAGPLALASAAQVAGWLAQYAWAAAYMNRAKVNAMTVAPPSPVLPPVLPAPAGPPPQQRGGNQTSS
jgi:hypothetical protein